HLASVLRHVRARQPCLWVGRARRLLERAGIRRDAAVSVGAAAALVAVLRWYGGHGAALHAADPARQAGCEPAAASRCVRALLGGGSAWPGARDRCDV